MKNVFQSSLCFAISSIFFTLSICNTFEKQDDTLENLRNLRDHDLSFQESYQEGIEAYLENNWTQCVKYLELAVEKWNLANQNFLKCRKLCHKESSLENSLFTLEENFTPDNFIEKLFKNTRCFSKCKNDLFESASFKKIDAKTLYEFEHKKPYEYLQVCYYELGEIQKAVDFAYTVLSFEPTHVSMHENLQFYMKTSGVGWDNVRNVELKEFGKEFFKAEEHFMSANYMEAMASFEKSLILFWVDLEDCRLLCEGPVHNFIEDGDFWTVVSYYFTELLKCKSRCASNLTLTLGERNAENFLASLLHYLQFSYYKQNKLNEACEAVESVLLLLPNHSESLNNKNILNQLEHVSHKYFVPNQKIVWYKNRLENEAKILEFDRFQNFNDETVNISFDETIKSSIDETVNISFDENIKSSIDETVNISFDEAVKNSIDKLETFKISIDETVQNYIDETVKNSADETGKISIDKIFFDETGKNYIDETGKNYFDETLKNSIDENCIDETVRNSIDENDKSHIDINDKNSVNKIADKILMKGDSNKEL